MRERSLPLLLQFIRLRSMTLEEAAEFNDNMLDIYINYSHQDYQLIRDSAKACMKIVQLMTLEDSWFRSRLLLYWTLYIHNKGVISIELADDMILSAFRGQFT